MKQDIDLKNQVKKILKVVEELAPGRSVELRIPLYAAIQCVEGVNHRRGTPTNVIEMTAATLIDLTLHPEKWNELCKYGLISASGTSSDLSEIFWRVSKLIHSSEGISNGQ
jgi:hypothetical protein